MGRRRDSVIASLRKIADKHDECWQFEWQAGAWLQAAVDRIELLEAELLNNQNLKQLAIEETQKIKIESASALKTAGDHAKELKKLLKRSEQDRFECEEREKKVIAYFGVAQYKIAVAHDPADTVGQIRRLNEES
jgi:Na+/phosphate symporter